MRSSLVEVPAQGRNAKTRDVTVLTGSDLMRWTVTSGQPWSGCFLVLERPFPEQ